MNEILLVNPRKRKAKKRRSVSRRRKNPVKRRRTYAKKRRTRRRNPTARGMVNQFFMPALVGAAGGLTLDIALGFIPVPLNLKTGIAGYAVKAAGAIGLGMLLKNMKLVKGKTALDMTVGALTIQLHGAMKEQVQVMLPNVPMGEYLTGPGFGNWVNSGYPAGVESDDMIGAGGMGAYLPDLSTEDLGLDSDGLGEYLSDGYETSGGYG